jgi:hypothetical protein
MTRIQRIMDDGEIFQRLSLVSEITTPTGRYHNRIVSLDPHSVTLASDAPTSRGERTIPFRDIRNWNTTNGCILVSLRRILGIE